MSSQRVRCALFRIQSLVDKLSGVPPLECDQDQGIWLDIITVIIKVGSPGQGCFTHVSLQECNGKYSIFDIDEANFHVSRKHG